jgi:WD40 repeat protein
MYRAIRVVLLALGCFLLACLSVLGVIFWPAIREYVMLPSRSTAKPRAVAAAPTPQIMPPPNIALPPQPRRRGNQSWKSVEAIFDESRAARDKHPGWKDHPSEAYDVVANPVFTDSVDLLDHCVKLSEWRRELPTSPTPLVALARAHIDWAWEARGYGYASSVTKEDWEQFYTRLAEARRLLEQAIQVGVKDGEAYRLLVLVGMAEGLPYGEVREQLDEGRKFDPTYFPMYSQFAQYLLPRWHGKRGDIELFAKEMVAELPGDDGLEAFARIAARVHKTDVERELLYFGEYDKSLLVKATQVLMDRRDGRQWETEFAALAAWVTQDREAAKQLLPHLSDGDDESHVWPSPQHRREFRFWCQREGFAEPDNARWFWGSMFYFDQLAFWKDSRSVWCGGGYGLSAMNRVDIHTGRIVQSLTAPAPRVDCFAVDSNKDWVVAGLTGDFYTGIMLWDLAEPDEPWVYPLQDTCWKIAIQPTGPHIAWFSKTGVTVFNIRTGQEVAKIKPKDSLRELRFSADGRLLIVSAADHQTVWDVSTGELRQDMPNFSHRPRPDAVCKKVLEIDENGYIWAIADKVKPPPHQSMLVRYSPDVQKTEILIPELAESVLAVHAALSTDRTLLAVNTIRASKEMPRIEIDVWHVATAKKIKHFAGHHSGLHAMSFSPDNRWLASMGFPQGLVKLWPIADEKSSEGEEK